MFSGIGVFLIGFVYMAIVSLGYSASTSQPRNLAHQFFHLFCIIFAIWLSANLLQAVSPTFQIAEAFLYMDYIFGPLVLYLLCMFLVLFPHAVFNKKTILKALLSAIPAFVVIGCVFSNLVITNIQYNITGEISSTPGAASTLYDLTVLGYLLFGLGYLVRTALKSTGLVKRQAWSLFATVLSTIGLITIINLFFSSQISSFNEVLVNAVSFVFVIGLSFIIHQFRLFGFRKLFTPLFVLGFFVVFGVFFLQSYDYVAQFAPAEFHTTIQILMLTMVLPITTRIRLYIEHFFENMYSGRRQKKYKLINKLLSSISKEDDLKEILSKTNQQIHQIIGTGPTWLLLHKSTNQDWMFYGNLLPLPAKQDPSYTNLIHNISQIKEPAIYDEIKKEFIPGGQKETLMNFMDQYNIAIIYPVRDNKEGVGAILGYIIIWSTQFADSKKDTEMLSMIIPELSRYIQKFI